MKQCLKNIHAKELPSLCLCVLPLTKGHTGTIYKTWKKLYPSQLSAPSDYGTASKNIVMYAKELLHLLLSVLPLIKNTLGQFAKEGKKFFPTEMSKNLKIMKQCLNMLKSF
jgi:hypothetical protein